jgi:thermostable 8-oxoguanine DNA glycosylase
MQPPIKASEFDGDLSDFLRQYKYQPELTKKLDDLDAVNVTPELLNEIVLWKVNRYVSLGEDQLRRIDAVRKLEPGEHRQAHPILTEFLAAHGVDLPMASTFLRFRNPSVFQIIDRHAYRALYGRDYRMYTQTSAQRKIEVYFAYLDDLRAFCGQKALKFETVDRVLYVFDKKTNGSLTKGNAAE